EGAYVCWPRHAAGASAPAAPAGQLEPVHGDAHRAGRDSLRDQFRHLLDVVVGGGLVGGTALTHHERAHRAVRNLRGDVDGAGDAVERVEVLADGLPVPLDGLTERRAG